MASSGLVLLLLVSFSFLICSLSVPQPSDRQENSALQKRGKKTETAKTVGSYIQKIVVAAKPLIAVIGKSGLTPGAGLYINFVIDLVMIAVGNNPNKPVLELLRKEFGNLNLKIDENQKQLEWNIWSSGHYWKLEQDITIAWNKLQDLLKNCADPCIDNLKRNGQDKIIENFFNKAEKYMDRLHMNIASSGRYNADYGKLLTDHVRCHEDQIKVFSILNVWLMYNAISMTHFYNLFNNIKTNEDGLANKAHDISAAMFQIHKKCISEPDESVKLDVKDRIDESKKRKDLAIVIRKHLDETFDRYNWMVVAFRTEKSKHQSAATKWRNRHTLTGFTVVERGEISVAFAKQAKGNNTQSEQVKQLLAKCFKKTVTCYDVEHTLVNCGEHINGVNVFEMCSAVHAYIHKEHGSVSTIDAKEAPTDDEEAPTEEDFETEKQTVPYIYTGKCSITKGINIGHFRVLIKSDEELMNEDPCKNVDCGGEQRGQCVKVENARIGLCECKKDYYGEKCEESMEEFKKSVLSKEFPKA